MGAPTNPCAFTGLKTRHYKRYRLKPVPPRNVQRAVAARSGWAARVSLTMGAPMRLPHSVQEPS